MTLTRRRLLLAVPLALLLVVGVIVFLFNRKDLKTRSAPIRIGMSRGEVVALLGKPALDMDRTENRGFLLVWVDQFWQLDVTFGRDGLVESVGTVPSDSAYNVAVKRVHKFFK